MKGLNFDLRVIAIVSFFLVVGAAILVSYATHSSRVLFSELQSLERGQERLVLEWGQLLLEKSTWSMPAIVEQTAREQFGMALPQSGKSILIELR